MIGDPIDEKIIINEPAAVQYFLEDVRRISKDFKAGTEMPSYVD